MANTDKNILITPNIGSSTDDPNIVFSGADASTAAQDISLFVYPASNGTVSFEGSSGQLFSITNDLTGTIFSVNDISGIPSIEVNADGTINLAEFGGNVGIGNATPTAKLDVTGLIFASGISSAQQSIAVSTGTTDLDLGLYDHFHLTMAASTTFTVSNAASKIGSAGNIVITQNGTGGYSFTLSSEMKTPLNGAAIAQVTTASTTSLLCYYVVSASIILVNYIGDFA